MDGSGSRLCCRRVPAASAQLEGGTAFRRGARACAREAQQRRPKAHRHTRLHISHLCYQLHRPAAGYLAGIQPPGRYGEPHRRAEERSGRRRLLPEAILRYRSRIPKHFAALQPAVRIPACRWPSRLLSASYVACTGTDLRRDSRPCRSPHRAASLEKLGWSGPTYPFAGPHLELANPNFAEVRTRTHDLTLRAGEIRCSVRSARVKLRSSGLRRLGTDRIDLYQLHKPDPKTPVAETLGALNDLVKAGKVREIGCSNFSAEQIREAEAAVPSGGTRFVSVQNQYNMVQREPEESVLPECERLGIAFLPYSPL